jgi:membrane-associated phospholipid phosphatase
MTRSAWARGAALALLIASPVATSPARADAIEQAGTVGAILIPAGAAAGAALAHDGQGVKQLALAYASTLAVVYVLKPLVDRTRPDGGSQSFPSGHSASAFAGAAFLQRRYGWRFGAPAYLAAAFVAYSRVEAKRHYTSDVVAGGAIGIAANLVFTHRREHVAVTIDGGRGHVATSVRVSW